jgi:pyruvate kinase
VTLKPGQTFTLDDQDLPGDVNRVYLPHPEILEAVQPGHRLLIDDGRLQLLAVESNETSITCKVVSGTKISDRKGVSLPDTTLGVGALTEKDRSDLDAVLAVNDVDWVALSFIQRPGRSGRSAQDRPWPGWSDVEDREAAGARASTKSSNCPMR